MHQNAPSEAPKSDFFLGRGSPHPTPSAPRHRVPPNFSQHPLICQTWRNPCIKVGSSCSSFYKFGSSRTNGRKDEWRHGQTNRLNMPPPGSLAWRWEKRWRLASRPAATQNVSTLGTVVEFLPRHAMHNRSASYVMRCLSVRLSHSYSVKTNKHVQNFFTIGYSYTHHSSFSMPNVIAIPMGTP